jgi:hypothetical protein
MEDTMYSENAKEAIKTILRECATPGTFWNRHFLSDDVIDIWRETNRTLAGYLEEPVFFDTFYLALQIFRRDYPTDFEAAAASFVSKLEAKPDKTLQEQEFPVRRAKRREPPRIQRTGTGGIKITGVFTPKAQEPIELTIVSSEDDWRRLYDYFNRYHNDFTRDLVFRFFSGFENQLK